MLPKAVTKSLQVISRCNLPFTTLQPFILGSSAAISGSLSFLAGMAFSSAPFHYAVEPRRRQRRHGKFVLTDRWRNLYDWLVPITLCHAVRSFLMLQLISRYSAA